MKLNLMVMFGGKSTEHEVSIISAIQAIENMDREKYNIVPIYISKSGVFYYHSNLLFEIKNFRDMKNLLSKCKRVEIVRRNNKVYIEESTSLFKKTITEIDIAFPIVHGTNVEDGNLQGFLHTFDIPIVGCDVTSSAIGMDKYVMKEFLKAEEIKIIPAKRYDINDFKDIDNLIERIEKEFPYPVIVKPTNLGSSIGINKAKDRESLKNAIEVAFSFSNLILVERAIVGINEINCSILGDRFEAVASTLEEPIGNGEILDFADKYLSNKKGKLNKSGKLNIGNNGLGKVCESQIVGANQYYKDEGRCRGENECRAENRCRGENGCRAENRCRGEACEPSCKTVAAGDSFASPYEKPTKFSAGTKNSGMASLSRKIPAEIDKNIEIKIKETAVKVFKLLGCSGVSRIDFIMDTKTNDVYVNEINTIPGSLSFYLWEPSGIKYKELIDRLIDIAKNNYRREKNLNFVFDSNILK